jgi:hypothetical protein
MDFRLLIPRLAWELTRAARLHSRAETAPIAGDQHCSRLNAKQVNLSAIGLYRRPEDGRPTVEKRANYRRELRADGRSRQY